MIIIINRKLARRASPAQGGIARVLRTTRTLAFPGHAR